MPQPVAPPRLPLSAAVDEDARRLVDRWQATQPRDEQEPVERPVTFNSAA